MLHVCCVCYYELGSYCNVLYSGDCIVGLNHHRLMSPHMLPPTMRSPTPAGAPIILAPRMQSLSTATATSTAAMMNGGPPPLMTPAEAGLIYPYDYQFGLAPALLEYPTAAQLEQSGAGTSYVR